MKHQNSMKIEQHPRFAIDDPVSLGRRILAPFARILARAAKRERVATMRLRNLGLLCVVAAAVTQSVVPVRAETISLTGWNQDIIAEKTAANPQAGTTTNVASWVWYEQGAPNSSQGLPGGGLITSVYGAGVRFQLQPYNGNNAVVLDSGTTTATVTLSSPKKFTSLQFLNSGQGVPGPTWNAQLNFSDSTSTTLSNVTDPDWTKNGNNARTSVGLVARNASWSGFYTGTLNLFEHDFTLSPGDQAKVLNSIKLTRTGGGILMFFALSGTAVVTGPTITAPGSPLSALSTIYGTASSYTSFTVSGVNMTAGILVTASAGFEVSQSSGSGYGSTTTVGSSGTIATTTVYVRLAAAAPVGTYNSQNIVLSINAGAATIAWTVPYGSSVTALAPTYTLSSAQATGSPVSGTTRDFTTPQIYRITAQDATYKDYTVTVTVASGIHAVDLTGPGDGPQFGTLFSVGWDFTVNQTITVTSLGQFDPDKNPQTNTVAIYQRGGAKLASTSVLATSPAELSGTYSARYAAITTLVLPAGNYVVMSTQNGDNFIAPGGSPTATFGTGITWNKGVALGAGSAAGPLPATAPANWPIENDTTFRYFGPTFKYTTVPPVPPTQLAIPTVNGGANPTVGTAFSVVVQARDAGGTPQNVTAATVVSLSLKTGTGSLGGTLSGTLTAGTSSVAISGITYSKAESGVVLTATRTNGDSLTAGDSAAFTVAAQPPLSTLGAIMPMGDSITLGVPVAGGYRDPLYTLLNNRGDTCTFVGSLTDYATSTLNAAGQAHHEGHSGYVIANGGGRSGLDENLAGWIGPGAANPDKILLMIGSNDINLGYDMANAPTRLSTLITHIYGYRPEVKLYVASIIPMVGHEPDVQAFNATLPDIVASHQALGRDVVYVPMYEGMNINTDLSDGLHPNALGYQHMAQVWDTALHPDYSTWASAHGVAGGKNAVGPDGISNLLLYALNLKLDGTNGSPGTLTGNVLSFTKRAEAVANGDVTYAIESSPDLQDPWTIVSPEVNDGTTISFTLPTGEGTIFARLKVTSP
ncbi:MAG: SGNH/GDSL hydrolase family protein [Akkermansiaceae bacterium]|nr:SGNH/GDSL hydrolase family protein [Akkermansiaceae bacterium]